MTPQYRYSSNVCRSSIVIAVSIVYGNVTNFVAKLVLNSIIMWRNHRRRKILEILDVVTKTKLSFIGKIVFYINTSSSSLITSGWSFGWLLEFYGEKVIFAWSRCCSLDICFSKCFSWAINKVSMSSTV